MRKAGFTLIELMVVVIIIAALAGMVLPRVLDRADEARSNIARGDIASITTALQMFRLNTGRYPTSEEGLNALMTRPGGLEGWRGPYLESAPVDPWGRDYQYRYPGVNNTTGFDLWSRGPSETASDDDITNW